MKRIGSSFAGRRAACRTHRRGDGSYHSAETTVGAPRDERHPDPSSAGDPWRLPGTPLAEREADDLLELVDGHGRIVDLDGGHAHGPGRLEVDAEVVEEDRLLGLD